MEYISHRLRTLRHQTLVAPTRSSMAPDPRDSAARNAGWPGSHILVIAWYKWYKYNIMIRYDKLKRLEYRYMCVSLSMIYIYTTVGNIHINVPILHYTIYCFCNSDNMISYVNMIYTNNRENSIGHVLGIHWNISWGKRCLTTGFVYLAGGFKYPLMI